MIQPRARGRAREYEDGGWTYEIEVSFIGDPEPIFNGVAEAKFETKEEAIKALTVATKDMLQNVVKFLEENGVDYLDSSKMIDLKTNGPFKC